MVPELASTGPAGSMLVAESRGAHGSKEPRHQMAKMDANAAGMALAVWNGYVRDARRHAGQWRPVKQVLQGSKDVSL